MQHVALVTGFEPYGGRGLNPAAEVARRLDGGTVADVRVIGRTVPVALRTLRQSIEQMLAELDPLAVISLGLWPGEPMIRLERVAVNVADFEIADNEGELVRDGAVVPGCPAAILATLPLREIEAALHEASIPARLSATAGTFLCNATLYGFLAGLEARGRDVPCGFIHLPYLPSQVVALLAEGRRERRQELHQRADLASMSLETMIEAVRIALATSLARAPAR